MLYHILFGVLLTSVLAGAQPAQMSYDPGETWAWGYGSEEGGGGSSYLGVDIADVTSDRLGALKMKEEHGAEVTMVDQDAPAGKAGLREHDVILSVNGTAIESAAQLRRIIRETPAERVINLGVSRDGQPLNLKVQLASRGKAMAFGSNVRDFKFEMPAMPFVADFDVPVSVVIAHSSLRSGLMVENITPQLGEFFGVKDGHGVLVRSVEKGSRADKAGFRAGDVVIKVNNQSVHDAADFTHALRSASKGPATVTVVRDRREQTLTLSLPEKKDTGILLEESEIPNLTAQMRQLTSLKSQIDQIRPSIEELQRQIPRQKELQRQIEQSKRKAQHQAEKLRHELRGEWTEI